MKRSLASVIALSLVATVATGCGTVTGGAVGAAAGAIYDITKHKKN